MSFAVLMDEARRKAHGRNGRCSTPAIVEREAAYHAALRLVARIDDDLQRGIRHYRTKAGKLLISLDEVVRAIIADDLEEPAVDVVQIVPQLVV